MENIIDVGNKIMKAKVGIILTQPFFATLMMRRNFIADTTIETANTNGKDIRYNPAFIESLPADQVQGVICHELMHSTLLHHIRRGGRDIKQWNKACDYALNPILLNSGMKLPDGCLVDGRFDNMSAESIFRQLEQEKQDEQPQQPEQGEGQGNGQQQPSNDPGGSGGVEDAPVHSEAEMAEAEAQSKQELAQAVQIAKQQGKLPAGIARMVAEIMQPKIAWQEVLARFLDEVVKNDYSFSRPNPRYIASGFIMPSLHNVEMGEIVLIVDTSGSVYEDPELLNTFAGEMQDIVSTFNATIRVIYVDSKFQGEQTIEPDDTFQLEPKGGGGTNFRPGFEYMDEQGITPKAIVYFTDLCCHSFPDEPDCPVLWAKWGDYANEVPFGEVIQVD